MVHCQASQFSATLCNIGASCAVSGSATLCGSLVITVIVTDSRLKHPVPIAGLRPSRRFGRD
jgi:hypothetical protein